MPVEEEFPEWVKVRACELCNTGTALFYRACHFNSSNLFPGLLAIARLVQKYEQEPVDPDVVKAREIVSNNRSSYTLDATILNGDLDKSPIVMSTLEGIKYGRSQGV